MWSCETPGPSNLLVNFLTQRSSPSIFDTPRQLSSPLLVLVHLSGYHAQLLRIFLPSFYCQPVPISIGCGCCRIHPSKFRSARWPLCVPCQHTSSSTSLTNVVGIYLSPPVVTLSTLCHPNSTLFPPLCRASSLHRYDLISTKAEGNGWLKILPLNGSNHAWPAVDELVATHAFNSGHQASITQAPSPPSRDPTPFQSTCSPWLAVHEFRVTVNLTTFMSNISRIQVVLEAKALRLPISLGPWQATNGLHLFQERNISSKKPQKGKLSRGMTHDITFVSK